MTDAQNQEDQEFWQTKTELPVEVFTVLRKPNRAINPVTVLATVAPDGSPHSAPFGSLRAITPRLLRLCCNRHHDTLANLRHDSRVMVAVQAPPHTAVSIRGSARVVQEHMKADANFALLEIDIQEVKNDMVGTGVIESAIRFSPHKQAQGWFDAILCELEDIGA